MRKTKLKTFVLIISTSYFFSCDRVDPESPEGGKTQDNAEQGADSILVKDPSLNANGDSDTIVIEESDPTEAENSAEEEQSESSDPSQPEVDAYSIYRINVSMMKTTCPGNAVNIEELRFKQSNDFLVDSFSDYPDSSNPIYNEGTIGGYKAQITSSGDYNSFYPFEAFGGGYGAGWWSAKDSFQNISPAPAASDVWLQITFTEQKPLFKSIFINGGSTLLGGNFRPCSPHDFTITASNDGQSWDVLATMSGMDTENGFEVILDYPSTIPQS